MVVIPWLTLRIAYGIIADSAKEQANMRSIKGFKQGRANGAAVLTESEVRVIRQKANDEGMSAPQLARIYRVSAETIRRILRGETWNWLDEAPRAVPQISYDAPVPDSPELQAEALASLERFRAKMGQPTPVPVLVPTQEDSDREARVAARMAEEVEKYKKNPNTQIEEFIKSGSDQDK